MENEKFPGGLPGVLPDGNPAKSNDITPTIRKAYTYQDFCIYIQICKSIKDSIYEMVWVELHEDFLGITEKNEIDAFQVKTKSNEGLMWDSNDTELGKIIKKFNILNKKEKIRKFYVYSNVGIYIPQESNKFSSNANKSIYFFKQQLINIKQDVELPLEALKLLKKISKQAECSSQEVRNVFYKLEFIKGPSLSSISEKNLNYLINSYPFLNKIKKEDIEQIEQKIFSSISRSSKSYTSNLDNHSSPILKNGQTHSEIYAKRIIIKDFKRILDNRKRKYYFKEILKYAVIFVIIVMIIFLIKHNKNENPLKSAIQTIKSAKDSNLPADFSSSIAIIRANNTNLYSIDLSGASLACQDMSKLDLRRMDGQYLKASGVDFTNSNLSNARLLNSELDMSKFLSAKLIHTNFTNSNLLYSNFKGSDSRFSTFDESRLQGAILNNADFTASSFKNVNFMYAEMSNSTFNESNFSHASFEKANISNSNFLDTKNLLQSKIDEACIENNSPAMLPKGLKQPLNICEDKTTREVLRTLIGVVGVNVTTNGYCKDNEIVFRPPDSKVMPENNHTFYVDNE